MLPTTIATFLNSKPHESTESIAIRWHQATADLKPCPNGFTGRIHYAEIGYDQTQSNWFSAEFKDAIVIIPNPIEILAKLERVSAPQGGRHNTPAFLLR